MLACNQWCATGVDAVSTVLCYLNDLNENVVSIVSKFSDSPKICDMVDSEEG